jgi:hypothetical protein
MRKIIASVIVALLLQSSAFAWKPGDPIFSRKEQETAKKNVEKAVQDTGNTLEKAAHDTGNTLEKAAHDTGNSLEKAAHDAGNTLEKAVHDTGAELERFFKRVCEDWLNISDGECHICWTSEGGEDGNGEFYACEDGDPDQGTPPSQIPNDKNKPTPEELEKFDRWVKASEPTHEELEPWENGVSRFLPGNKVLGTPFPADMKLLSVTEGEDIREKDDYGIGYFLAPRAVRGADGNRSGTRYHGGVDFVTTPGEKVFSPIDGKVIRVSNAYASNNHGLKAVVVQKNGFTAKILYVKPASNITVGSEVTAGSIIGHAQDISVKFKEGMTNHVHLTLQDLQGRKVSPDNKWVIKPKRK